MKAAEHGHAPRVSYRPVTLVQIFRYVVFSNTLVFALRSAAKERVL